MPTKIAINGFGRIGRLVFRALVDQGLLGKDFEVVAINDLVPADNLAYLLKYDSVQGKFAGTVSSEKSSPDAAADDTLVVNGQKIKCLALRAMPNELPWAEHGIDIVIESTGLFVQDVKAKGHLEAGAKKVIISAPGKGDGVKTVVMGVNDDDLTAADDIISNASCTTNCLAPITKVILENFGIRAAAMNIIPSSTGAAKAVGLVLPEVKGKLTGMAFRVPTPTVSVVDLTVKTEKPTSYEEICQKMKEASESGSLKGYLGYTEDEVVSSDFIHDAASSVFDAGSGIGLSDTFFKLVSWYDNEWGYSNRVVDLLKKVVSL